MSPKARQIGPYSFHFYMVDCRERMHIHVYRGKKPADKTAKFWLKPDVELAWNSGFTNRELAAVAVMILDNVEYFREFWDEKCKNQD